MDGPGQLVTGDRTAATEFFQIVFKPTKLSPFCFLGRIPARKITAGFLVGE